MISFDELMLDILTYAPHFNNIDEYNGSEWRDIKITPRSKFGDIVYSVHIAVFLHKVAFGTQNLLFSRSSFYRDYIDNKFVYLLRSFRLSKLEKYLRRKKYPLFGNYYIDKNFDRLKQVLGEDKILELLAENEDLIKSSAMSTKLVENFLRSINRYPSEEQQ